MDMLLLEQKKDKCIEIFKTSSLIHDILQKIKTDENLQNLNLDLNSVIHMMFNDKHFLNSKEYIFRMLMNAFDLVLANQLSKKLAANKLEKFIAERI